MLHKLSDVLKLAKMTNGEIPLDEDGEYIYVVKSVDEDNFHDLPKPFIDQLWDERKYGDYVSCIVFRSNIPEISSIHLPIHGFDDKYTTKWLYRDIEDCVKHDLSDKQTDLYNRIMNYSENRERLNK